MAGPTIALMIPNIAAVMVPPDAPCGSKSSDDDDEEEFELPNGPTTPEGLDDDPPGNDEVDEFIIPDS